MNKKDTIVHSIDLYETKDYSKFSYILGNRPIDERHVRMLAKKMREEGNLMDKFPVKIDKNGGIIDGQHRIAAAKLNNYPVFYSVIDDASDNTIISINTGSRNWRWQDYARYHASKGNDNYKKFVVLIEEFGYKFHVLLAFSVLRDGRNSNDFNEGKLEILDYDLTFKLLSQYRKLRETANNSSREFALACLRMLRNPKYDHEHMVNQIMAYGNRLQDCYIIGDYIVALEEIRKA